MDGVTLDDLGWVRDCRAMAPDALAGPNTTARDVLDFYKPLTVPDGAVALGDVVVGTAGRGGRPLKAWVYGRRDRSESAPGIVMVHGGGWIVGNPEAHLWQAAELAARGYAVAVVTYRLSGEAKWPAALQDVKCAVRWFRASASEFGLDPDRIGIYGSSAGGHLAAMTALTPGLFEGEGGHAASSSAVQAACLAYPITDFNHPATTQFARDLSDEFLGTPTPDLRRVASPVTYVHEGAVPIVTVCGELDDLTPPAEMRDFHAALAAVGARNHEFVVLPGETHGFDFYPRCFHDAVDRMDRFFAAQLSVEGATQTRVS